MFENEMSSWEKIE